MITRWTYVFMGILGRGLSLKPEEVKITVQTVPISQTYGLKILLFLRVWRCAGMAHMHAIILIY